MTDLAEHALRYAKLGLAVVPLIPNEKRPMFENWPEVATSDITTVDRWWKQTPNANVGIATGPKSRLFVLDVDIAKGGQDSFDSLVLKYGQTPRTWQQVTGGGGFHLFFRYPAFRVANATGLWPGIDIRGDGGQVVAPPSIHPNGDPYFWDGEKEIEQEPIAEAPGWLLEVLQQKAARPQSDKLPIDTKIPKGVQHDTLVALAGALRRMGLDVEEIVPSLLAVNRRRCTEPGDDDHVRRIAESMARYRPSDADLFSTATRLWRVTRAREAEKAREDVNLHPPVVDGLTVFRTPAAEQQCVIENLLYNGLTIFAGRPKVGKSWLTMQLALAVAQGTRFLGSLAVLRPGGVLYLGLEETQGRTSKRMNMLQDVESAMLQNITMVYDIKRMSRGGLEQLDAMIVAHQPNVVVIDTFLRFVGDAGGDSRNVLRGEYAEMQALFQLAHRHKTAVVVIHHMRKPVGPGESGLDMVAGSTGITAPGDAIWAMKREDAGVCSLEIFGRDTEEQTLALRFPPDGGVGWDLIGTGDQVKSMKDERELLDCLRAEGALSPGRLAMLTRTNVNRTRTVLANMQSRGLVHRQSNGTFLVSRVTPGDRD